MTTKKLEAWGLRYSGTNELLFAVGCVAAPWTFRSREGARKAAREWKEQHARIPKHGEVQPVRIRVAVEVEIIK